MWSMEIAPRVTYQLLIQVPVQILFVPETFHQLSKLVMPRLIGVTVLAVWVCLHI